MPADNEAASVSAGSARPAERARLDAAGWRRLWTLSLLVPSVTLLAYWPALMAKYARLDDYVAVYRSNSLNLDEVWPSSLAGGRPIPGLLMGGLLSLSTSVEDLAWLRLSALAAIIVAAVALAVWGSSQVRDNSQAVWIVGVPAAALVVGMPGADNMATWAILAVQAWALPAAVLAGVLLELSRLTPRRITYAVCVLLIFVSAFSYQQFAAVALLPPLLGAALAVARGERPSYERLVVAFAAVGAALLSNYLLVLAVGAAIAERATDRAPLAETVHWFVAVFLPRTVSLQVQETRSTTTLWGLLLLALLLAPALRGRRYLVLSAAVLVAWAAAAAPMLLVGEQWASLRVVYPAQLVLWTGAWLAASWAWLERPRVTAPAGASLAAVAAGVLALSLTALAGNRAYFYYAAPNANDWRSAQCVAQSLPDGLQPGDAVRLQPFTAARASIFSYDEAGLVAAAVPWAVKPMLWLASYEIGAQPRFDPMATESIPVVGPEEPAATGTRREVTVWQDACERSPSLR